MGPAGSTGVDVAGGAVGRGSLSTRRRTYGYLLAVAGTGALAAVLAPLRGGLDLASDALLFLLLVVVSAIVGGLGPALVAGALGAGLLNFFFTRPFHTFRIRDASDVVAVVVFGTTAVLVSWVVDLAARRASAAREAAELEAGNRLRTALLAAVGHDLRTPLATAKAVVSSLRSREVTLGDGDRRELLETADDALDRLTALVENLLDLSRLQAGALPVRTRPEPLEDVVARALDDLGAGPRVVVVDLPEHLPDAVVDAGLLERVLVNLLANAQRHAPGPLRVTGSAAAGRVLLRVVDAGPGIGAADRDRVFVPFQRLGDSSGAGLGLGLALSRGLVEAMDGTVALEDTPGGGLTVVVSLPAAAPQPRAGVAP
jgi:two-component system sensor histidine kinase KdpD